MSGEARRRTGGCACGAVRYTVTGLPSPVTLCHCESCRRHAGAPVVAWVTFPLRAVRFEGTAPTIRASSAGVSRGFCGRCGTPISYAHGDHPGWLDLTVCSMDEPADLPPADHTWTEDRLPWMEDIAALPAHRRTRRG